MPTLSSIPPERANAVVVVVVVIVDVARRRNAKEKYNAQPNDLLPLLRPPCDGHILNIGYHLGPIGRGTIIQKSQLHGKLYVKLQLITEGYCPGNLFTPRALVGHIIDSISLQQCFVDIHTLDLDPINQGMSVLLGVSVAIGSQLEGMESQLFGLNDYL